MAGIPLKKLAAVCAAAALSALIVVGCASSGQGNSAAAGGDYKDGTYTGQSSTLDAGVDGDGYGVVSVTIKDGAIVDATFQAFLPDGTVKDDSYGKGTVSYSLAQKVISYTDDYAQALVETGTPDGVDVISGATFLHDQFVEAAEDALKQAEA